MAQGGIFKMLDVCDEELEELVEKNKKLFSELGEGNWFYLANDEELTDDPNMIRYADRNGWCEDTDEHDLNGAILLTAELKRDLMNVFEQVCVKFENSVIPFTLKNEQKTPGVLGVMYMADDTKKVCMIIPNLDEETVLPAPFMVNYNPNEDEIEYDLASKEQGSLPYMAENDVIFDLLPDELKKFLDTVITEAEIDENEDDETEDEEDELGDDEMEDEDEDEMDEDELGDEEDEPGEDEEDMDEDEDDYNDEDELDDNEEKTEESEKATTEQAEDMQELEMPNEQEPLEERRDDVAFVFELFFKKEITAGALKAELKYLIDTAKASEEVIEIQGRIDEQRVILAQKHEEKELATEKENAKSSIDNLNF